MMRHFSHIGLTLARTFTCSFSADVDNAGARAGTAPSNPQPEARTRRVAQGRFRKPAHATVCSVPIDPLALRIATDGHRLSAEEGRVLGCLVEKELSTPDQYPLTLNALVTACNQATSRDPVVRYDEGAVDRAFGALRGRGLGMHVAGGRATRHRHRLADSLGLSRPQQVVLALLLLRGPQTPAELRARSERMHAFSSSEEVERTIDELAAMTYPFVERLPRAPGQKEARVVQRVCDAGEVGTQVPREARRSSSDEIAELRADVESLRAEVEELRALVVGEG